MIKACIYRGVVYPTMGAAAETTELSMQNFCLKVRNGKITDIQIISVAKYEQITGKQHPSRYNTVSGNRSENVASNDLDIDMNQLIKSWPVTRV